MERVFSERGRKENEITFGQRKRSLSAEPRIEQMLKDVLEGLNAIGPRLDAIEKELKELHQGAVPKKHSPSLEERQRERRQWR